MNRVKFFCVLDIPNHSRAALHNNNNMNKDPIVRKTTLQHMLLHDSKVDENTILTYLFDTYAPIRDTTATYLRSRRSHLNIQTIMKYEPKTWIERDGKIRAIIAIANHTPLPPISHTFEKLIEPSLRETSPSARSKSLKLVSLYSKDPRSSLHIFQQTLISLRNDASDAELQGKLQCLTLTLPNDTSTCEKKLVEYLHHDASTVRQAASSLCAKIVTQHKSLNILESFPHHTSRWQAREGYLLSLDATFRSLLEDHHRKHSSSVLSIFLTSKSKESLRSILLDTFRRCSMAISDNVFELRRK